MSERQFLIEGSPEQRSRRVASVGGLLKNNKLVVSSESETTRGGGGAIKDGQKRRRESWVRRRQKKAPGEHEHDIPFWARALPISVLGYARKKVGRRESVLGETHQPRMLPCAACGSHSQFLVIADTGARPSSSCAASFDTHQHTQFLFFTMFALHCHPALND